jgi:hypothetical protein
MTQTGGRCSTCEGSWIDEVADIFPEEAGSSQDLDSYRSSSQNHSKHHSHPLDTIRADLEPILWNERRRSRQDASMDLPVHLTIDRMNTSLMLCIMPDENQNLVRQETPGGAIAWAFAIPVFIATPCCFVIPTIVPKFAPMFYNLHAKLSLLTQGVLAMPAAGWIIIPMATVMTLLFILLRTGDDSLKLLSAVAAALIVFGEIAAAFWGIYSPILQLQKQLSSFHAMPSVPHWILPT